jgi:hypothetical protein
MKMTKSKITASSLQTNDHFKIAGRMYRVITRSSIIGNSVLIHAYSIEAPEYTVTLTMRNGAPITIYNQ